MSGYAYSWNSMQLPYYSTLKTNYFQPCRLSESVLKITSSGFCNEVEREQVDHSTEWKISSAFMKTRKKGAKQKIKMKE